jgi:hypothetical protein
VLDAVRRELAGLMPAGRIDRHVEDPLSQPRAGRPMAVAQGRGDLATASARGEAARRRGACLIGLPGACEAAGHLVMRVVGYVVPYVNELGRQPRRLASASAAARRARGRPGGFSPGGSRDLRRLLGPRLPEHRRRARGHPARRHGARDPTHRRTRGGALGRRRAQPQSQAGAVALEPNGGRRRKRGSDGGQPHDVRLRSTRGSPCSPMANVPRADTTNSIRRGPVVLARFRPLETR